MCEVFSHIATFLLLASMGSLFNNLAPQIIARRTLDPPENSPTCLMTRNSAPSTTAKT
jgi:hypothetical protein